MRSYQDDRWLTASDAHTTKMTGCVEALPDDWTWLWIFPEMYQCDAERGRWDKLSNVDIARVPWGDNVQEARFFFPIREMKALVENFKPDVLICETPEHVQSWKLVQERTGVRFAVIASWQHVNIYDETSVPVDYMMRQYEGFLHADARAFPLRFMKDAFYEYINEEFGVTLMRSVADIWPGLYSPRELDECASQSVERPASEPTKIFFISRLSDNQRTRWKEFAEATRILSRERDDFRVWVANPNEAEPWDSMQHIFGNYEMHPYGESTLERPAYLDLLWRADVVPFLYRMDRIYSVGFCEAITARNAILTVEAGGVSAAKQIAHPTAREIAKGISRLVDERKDAGVWRAMLDGQCDWLYDARSIESNIEYMKRTIEGAVR